MFKNKKYRKILVSLSLAVVTVLGNLGGVNAMAVQPDGNMGGGGQGVNPGLGNSSGIQVVVPAQPTPVVTKTRTLSKGQEAALWGARNPDVTVPSLLAEKNGNQETVDTGKNRQFSYNGEAVPNSDPILYVGDYDMYTTEGMVRFTLTTEEEDKIRVVGPFSPETMNHYYLVERNSYGDAARAKLLPNTYSIADVSVQSMPIKPEIAQKAVYIKQFGNHYVSVVMTGKTNQNYAVQTQQAKAMVQNIINSIQAM